MKYIIFARRRNFIQAMIAIFFGIIASSCAPQLDIAAITAEAQNELLMMDESDRPYHHSEGRSLQAEDITDGVIEDYLTLIDFSIKRNELRAKSLTPTIPIFTDTGITYPRVIFFYMGGYDIDRDNYDYYLKQCKTNKACIEGIIQSPAHPIFVDRCRVECAKILFEGHAKSVLKVEINPDRLEVVPSSIREFRKTDDCSLSSDYRASGFSRHELAALGLCLDMQTPENGLELLEEDGLHVFGTWNSLISPFRPEEFWVDLSIRAPLAIGMQTYSRSVHVMKDLEHVTAWRYKGSKHRAIGIRSAGRPIEYSMLFDHTCISIEPELPQTIVNKLIKARAGEDSLNPSYSEGDKFYFGDDGLCQGQDIDHFNSTGLFSNESGVRIDFASLFSPQEIEDKLNATMRTAKSKGDAAEEWRALNTALHRIEKYHTEYDAEIAHRIVPIVFEAIKHDLRTSNFGYYNDTLRRMPHESLEPYLDDLIWIIEERLSKVGCEGLRCPQSQKCYRDLKSHPLRDVAEILSGAGPKAEKYLEQIELVNEDMIAKFGLSQAVQIGGTENARLCIHNRSGCRRR